mgnify:CR=1 FL=1
MSAPTVQGTSRKRTMIIVVVALVVAAVVTAVPTLA